MNFKLQKLLLIIVAIGLLPIALSYGLMPEKSLNYLYDISVTEVNHIHIFRAIMGLYLALIVFWFIGVFKVQLRTIAVYSMVVFMWGLAAGRIVSLIIDGIPHWLLVVYLFLEITFGLIGFFLVKKQKDPMSP